MNLTVEQFLQDEVPPELMEIRLEQDFAEEVVNRLKREADRYWYTDPQHSLKLAHRIMDIGRRREDRTQVALGLLALGNGFRLMGRWTEARDSLEQAGRMFQESQYDFGWARTQISRLDVALRLGQVADVLANAPQARAIFTDCGDSEMLIRLNLQEGWVHNYLGDHQRALQLYYDGVATAHQSGEMGQNYLVLLYTNMGLANDYLGDFHQALAYYEAARELAARPDKTFLVETVKANMAAIASIQGRYRYALKLLQEVIESLKGKYPFRAMYVKYDVVECYLYLNRYTEALALAQEVAGAYRQAKDMYGLAQISLHLALAQAGCGNFAGAKMAMREAEQIFLALDAPAWVATTRLRQGQVALKQGQMATAYESGKKAAAQYAAGGQQAKYAAAMLLQGQALLGLENPRAAASAAREALHIAQKRDVPSLRYGAHLLLGKAAEAEQDLTRAARRYQAAAATIDRVQADLTITLRSDFLEDKEEALKKLIGLLLREGKSAAAFEALERAKSQVLFGYLQNREASRWPQDDARNRGLIESLNRLRVEHQRFYRLAHPINLEEARGALSPAEALAETQVREQQMRRLVEELYLRSGEDRIMRQHLTAALGEIQRTAGAEALLIEYYHDEEGQWWAFCLDGHSVKVQRLPLTVDGLDRLLGKLQVNFTAALSRGPQSPMARNLTHPARLILQKLYAGLIEPLALGRFGRSRLMIVPYGLLHYLPFHLLHDGAGYLVERYEVVILPAAGLAPRRGPRREPGALVLAHSWEGSLPYSLQEAKMVQRMFGGPMYAEEESTRARLERQPTQILHIAAHGECRLDQPDLSYVQLADGQLYTDDLLQLDLSYELVTVSACETGRAKIAARDELIGLGRGFLYAGAGALLLSLWQVADASAFRFMERVYRTLQSGGTKAAAVREAQCSMLGEDTGLHPAYWGAFQLVGNADPLSPGAPSQDGQEDSIGKPIPVSSAQVEAVQIY